MAEYTLYDLYDDRSVYIIEEGKGDVMFAVSPYDTSELCDELKPAAFAMGMKRIGKLPKELAVPVIAYGIATEILDGEETEKLLAKTRMKSSKDCYAAVVAFVDEGKIQ